VEILQRFEDPRLVRGLRDRIHHAAPADRPLTLMEVCGTHTQAVGRWGLRELLPPGVRLVSGPGCPVCVTPGDYIDNACRLALEHGAVLATFGDLIRVPGRRTSLEEAQSAGAEVRTLYSPREALDLARAESREVVFLAIGFETTIAALAGAMHAAAAAGLPNLSFYCSLRTVPPALAALLADPEVSIDGFLLPGHVSVVIGTEPYGLLAEAGVPGAVAGFEPVEILQGVAALLEDVAAGTPRIRNLYGRVVRPEGNPQARALIEKLLEPTDAVWRGIGEIPASGLALRPAYRRLDAAARFGLAPASPTMPAGCACGQVLRGVILPPQCPLFGDRCTPVRPVGPCMVSSEGSCAAHHRYAGAAG
jgi:hydrogenase expression/formation protein HypD